MVVYGKNSDPKAFYRFWNGSVWSNEGQVSAPVGVTSEAKWITVSSDPSTNHLGLGVLASDAKIWLNIWNGTDWENAVLASNGGTGTIFPNLDVAFESESGNAIGLVSVNTDAINALNAALNGVQLLGEVVTHIEAAAGAVDSATAGAIKAISASIDSEENRKRIDQLAVDAVTI